MIIQSPFLDYLSYVENLDRELRYDWFLAHEKTFSDSEYWGLLRYVYQTVYPWKYRAQLRELFLSSRPGREWLMEDDDRKVFDSLPDVITIYRSSSVKDPGGALSWTTSISNARKYKKTYESEGMPQRLLTRTVKKSQAICYWCNLKELIVVK